LTASAHITSRRSCQERQRSCPSPTSSSNPRRWDSMRVAEWPVSASDREA
jgi:hypothetical protein